MARYSRRLLPGRWYELPAGHSVVRVEMPDDAYSEGLLFILDDGSGPAQVVDLAEYRNAILNKSEIK